MRRDGSAGMPSPIESPVRGAASCQISVYLPVNHAWRLIRPEWLKSSTRFLQTRYAASIGVTFISVAAAMVLFRATTVETAGSILARMFGMHGFAIPVQLIQNLDRCNSFATNPR